MTSALPVVIDTNVVLDWLVFDDPLVQPVARALECRQALQLISSAACLEELRRVLAFPSFRLHEAAQADALQRYQAQAVMVSHEFAGPSGLPRCTDRDDQKFLELAWHSGARWLITRDKALLRMARRIAKLGCYTVILPQAFEAPARLAARA